MKSTTDYLNEAFDIYSRMSFSDKCKTSKSIREISAFISPSLIRWNGYVVAKEKFALYESNGNSYVYLWKHIDGDIFYIGSGTGDRWTQKYRNTKFLREIDKGDAVVYKVLSGVDRQTAFLYERYISYSLSKAGYELCNSDNIATNKNLQAFEEWRKCNQQELSSERCQKVENIILNKILLDDDFTYGMHKDILKFQNECGENYFTENYTSYRRVKEYEGERK